MQEVMAALGSKLEAAEQTSRYVKVAVPHSSVADPDPAVKKLDLGILDPDPGSNVQLIYISKYQPF